MYKGNNENQKLKRYNLNDANIFIIKEYEILENKIRLNIKEEGNYLKVGIYALSGVILSSAKVRAFLDPLLYFFVLMLYLFLPLALFARKIYLTRELLVSGGYKRALEEFINNKLDMNVLLWESELVPKFLRSKVDIVVLFSISFLLLTESAYLYFIAYNSILEVINDKNYAILIVAIFFVLWSANLSILGYEYVKIKKYFYRSYKVASKMLNQSKIFIITSNNK
jgi:hypothetical protein